MAEQQQLSVHIDEHFVIESCGTCSVPGYLIVRLRQTAKSLSQMSPAALAMLGPTLAMTTQVIEAAVHPERVYCALFSEQTHGVHFHLFPRTAWLANEYAAAHPGDLEISGPRVMDWARRVFRQPIPGRDGDEILQKIRDHCRRAKSALEKTVDKANDL